MNEDIASFFYISTKEIQFPIHEKKKEEKKTKGYILKPDILQRKVILRGGVFCFVFIFRKRRTKLTPKGTHISGFIIWIYYHI